MVPPEKKKDGMLSGMTSRQKMIAAVLVIILLVIIWQIMGLFGGGGGSAPPTIAEITPAQKQQTGQMTSAVPGTAGAAAPINAPVQQPVTQSGEPVPFREVPVSMEAQILDLQKKTEQKYLDQLNQLQMLKIQREIAETNQAIASARLATVTAEKTVSDLLTKPTQPPTPPPVPAGFTAAGPATAVAIVPEGGAPPPAENVPPPPPPSLIAPYTVISVSMQLGRWTAVLAFQGKLFSVTIGDVLPVDGAVVTSISRNGVVLAKEGKRKRISIVSSL